MRRQPPLIHVIPHLALADIQHEGGRIHPQQQLAPQQMPGIDLRQIGKAALDPLLQAHGQDQLEPLGADQDALPDTAEADVLIHMHEPPGPHGLGAVQALVDFGLHMAAIRQVAGLQNLELLIQCACPAHGSPAISITTRLPRRRS